MDNFLELIESFKNKWELAFKNALANPSTWQPHLGNLTVDVINEIVSSILELVSKTRAPKGFAPTFPIAVGLATIHIKSIDNTLNLINANQGNHISTFISQLTQLLMHVNLINVLGDAETSGNLNVKLAENIALIQTAQKELAHKKALLEETEKTIAQIEEWSANIEKKHSASLNIYDQINQSHSKVTELSTSISKELENLTKNNTESERIAKLISNHNSKFEALQKELEEIITKSNGQQQTIDELLPNAASAGLAGGFRQRKDALSASKWTWFAIMLICTAAISAFSFYLVGKFAGNDLLGYLLPRIPLGAPLVFLLIFSAIQYGHTVRVQEDYAFKEATSKAFAGYKDHMEYLAKVNPQEANSAMEELSIKTINILANEPLRVYGKAHHDASILNKILSMEKNQKGEN